MGFRIITSLKDFKDKKDLERKIESCPSCKGEMDFIGVRDAMPFPEDGQLVEVQGYACDCGKNYELWPELEKVM